MRREQGSVMVEAALVLPVLILLVIGGWVLSYLAYTRMALALTASRAARDLAAATEGYGDLARFDTAYRYSGSFAESFGLPRWGVQGLVLKTEVKGGKWRLVKPKEVPVANQAVVVAVCYRVPFTVPFGVVAKPAPPKQYLPDTSKAERAVITVADFLRLIELRRQVEEYRIRKGELEEEIAAWDRLKADAQKAWERAERLGDQFDWAVTIGEELVKGRQDFTPYRELKPEELDAAVRELCSPPERLRDRSIVMTGRAAYLLQEVYEPKGGIAGVATVGSKQSGQRGR